MLIKDVHTRLVEQLIGLMPHAFFASSRHKRWASATFTGARHNFVFKTANDQALMIIKSLASQEFTIPNHLVADICVIAQQRGPDGCELEIEALTVEEN